MSLRSPGAALVGMVLETEVWALGALTATGASLFLVPCAKV